MRAGTAGAERANGRSLPEITEAAGGKSCESCRHQLSVDAWRWWCAARGMCGTGLEVPSLICCEQWEARG